MTTQEVAILIHSLSKPIKISLFIDDLGSILIVNTKDMMRLSMYGDAYTYIGTLSYKQNPKAKRIEKEIELLLDNIKS